MTNKDKKIMFRFYTITDFEKEQEFLTNQHRKGYKFVKYIFPGFYVFESCQPENVIYQLDYSGVADKDKSSYLQIFLDCGWEYMFDFNGWSYFRKVAATDEDISIFSDNESKVLLYERIKDRLLPLVVIFLCCFTPQVGNYSHYPHWMQIIFLLLFVLYVYIFVSYVYRLSQLKKNMFK